MKFDRIAVGIDFSQASRDALDCASSLVRKGGRLDLVHSVESALLRWSSELESEAVDDTRSRVVAAARTQLESWAAGPRADGVQVELAIKEGRPADELLATSAGVDLLVLGTHARGLLDRVVLGSVAEEVANRSTIPVLVVRPPAEGAKQAPVSRVVVAVDPDGLCRFAVGAASDLAKRLSVPLEAVHVVRLATGRFSRAPAEDAVERHKGTVSETVKAALTRAGTGADVPVRVVMGRPAQQILAQVKPGDILACGTHGRAGLGRLVFGSVAAKLVRYAPCPVLVVRPTPGAV